LGLAQIRVGPAAAYVGNINSVLQSDDSLGALANTKFTSNVDYWKLESGFPMLEDLTIPIRESAMMECAFKEVTPKNLALARGLDPFGGGAKAAAAASVINQTSGDLVVADPAGITVDPTYGLVDIYTMTFVSATAYTLDSYQNGPLTSDGVVDITTQEIWDFGVNPAITIPANFVTGTITAGDVVRFLVIESSSAYADNHSGSIGLGNLKAPEYIRMEAVYTYPNGTNHMYVIFPRANVTASTEIDLQAEDNANVPLVFESKRADSEVAGGDVVWDAMPLGRIYFD
jgi:hypothetical protein